MRVEGWDGAAEDIVKSRLRLLYRMLSPLGRPLPLECNIQQPFSELRVNYEDMMAHQEAEPYFVFRHAAY